MSRHSFVVKPYGSIYKMREFKYLHGNGVIVHDDAGNALGGNGIRRFGRERGNSSDAIRH